MYFNYLITNKENFEIINNDIKTDVHFAIIMTTFRRSNNKSIEYLNRSLNSIINQEYKNWTLILVGDKYEPEDELLKIINNFKNKTSNEIIYLNNQQVEREYIKNKYKLWMCAGGRSINIGLKYARENNFKYYCHLDDDDFWTSKHLLYLAQVYSKYPNCIFANTKSTYINTYLPNNDMEIYENNRPPLSNNTVHSSYSFRLDILPFYYNTSLNENDIILPSDAQMLDNIKNFIENNKKYSSIYISKLTCYHDFEGETKL